MTTESAFADIAAAWRAAGILPPEGTPLPPRKDLDVAALIAEQRMARWREWCPAEFQKLIDRAMIPNVAAWDEADKWEGTHPGLWLWSDDTGMAKSRMLWRKFCQLHVRKGKSVLRVTGLNLAEEYHDAFNKSNTAIFYHNATRADVVLLDDLDKMTLPVEGASFGEQGHAMRNIQMLREVFDKFYEQHTAVLVTAQKPISWFEEMSASAGRRMREVCREISFAAGGSK